MRPRAAPAKWPYPHKSIDLADQERKMKLIRNMTDLTGAPRYARDSLVIARPCGSDRDQLVKIGSFTSNGIYLAKRWDPRSKRFRVPCKIWPENVAGRYWGNDPEAAAAAIAKGRYPPA